MDSKKKKFFLFCILSILVIIGGILVFIILQHNSTVTKDDMDETIEDSSSSQVQADSRTSHNVYRGWTDTYGMNDSEWDYSDPRIKTTFLTNRDRPEMEEIVVEFTIQGCVMYTDSFPNGVEEFTITDKNRNNTTVKCEDNGSDNNILWAKYNGGVKYLISLKEQGAEFTLKVKGKNENHEACYKVYDIQGDAAPGLKTAIQNHVGIEL